MRLLPFLRANGFLAFLCATHIAILWSTAQSLSPTRAEPAHLAAGISHWRFADFSLYRVNPPLVRMVAALPILLAGGKDDWSSFSTSSNSRAEFAVGRDTVAANGPRALSLMILARIACIPFSLLGAYVCYRWANELYGNTAALAAAALWCFCPIVAGHGALITPDVGAASMGFAACYLFWRWLKEPTWRWALLAGGGLGLAELTKFTWLILFAVWPVTALILSCVRRFRRLPSQGESAGDPATISKSPRLGWSAAQVAAMLSLAVFVVNLGYAFEGSCGRLGDQRFVSRLFKGSGEGRDERDYGRHNRFVGTWLETAPVPLPADYVLGIDVQRRDFEAGMPTFFRGDWRDSAPWYAYFYALAIKLPLGTLCLFILAAIDSLVRRDSGRDEFVLLFPALVLFAVACGHTGLHSQVRYVLPALPFLFVWAAKSARAFALGNRRIGWLAALVLGWSIAATLYNHPHHLSYFNELCRWPSTAPPPLFDSNLDWGQDLVYLREWSERHPEARPLRVACYSGFDPADIGIDCLHAADVCDGQPSENRPPAGWYVLSLGDLWGRGDSYAYFRPLEPVAVLGSTIHIYHLARVEK